MPDWPVNGSQLEGEVLARKNGELDAVVRKLRAVQREGEAERERLAARLATQAAALAREQERFGQLQQHAAAQARRYRLPRGQQQPPDTVTRCI